MEKTFYNLLDCVSKHAREITDIRAKLAITSKELEPELYECRKLLIHHHLELMQLKLDTLAGHNKLFLGLMEV